MRHPNANSVFPVYQTGMNRTAKAIRTMSRRIHIVASMRRRWLSERRVKRVAPTYAPLPNAINPESPASRPEPP